MAGSPWEPPPEDLTPPEWDLLVQLRFLLDSAGVSVDELARDEATLGGPPAVGRVMAGQAFPSLDLIALIVRRCGGDRDEVADLYRRAAPYASPDRTVPPAGRGAQRRMRRRIPRGAASGAGPGYPRR